MNSAYHSIFAFVHKVTDSNYHCNLHKALNLSRITYEAAVILDLRYRHHGQDGNSYSCQSQL